MQRRENIDALAVAGATVPAAMLSEAAAPTSRAMAPQQGQPLHLLLEAHDGRACTGRSGGAVARSILNSFWVDHANVGLPDGRVR